MEAMTVQYQQAALPKLRITEEISRRDSITSSKTGDSGYISDPDISLSPLDFVRPDKSLLYPDIPIPPPPVPSLAVESTIVEANSWGPAIPNWRFPKNNHGSLLLKKNSSPSHALKVTSDPSSCGSKSPPKKLDWTSAFKNPPTQASSAQQDNVQSEAHLGISRENQLEQWIHDSLSSHGRPKERVSSIVSISSTGSGGDYSVTDDSEMEEIMDEPISSLSPATLKTIELILRKVELNLNHAAYVQCAGGQANRGQPVGEPSRGRRGSAQIPGGKRKLRGEDGLPPDDDDGPNKRRRVSVTTTEESESGPRFACPFYKHDPNRYRNRRTCPGPGWPTVHRMKEHLYRSHAQPIYCPRCFTMFDADSDLANHLRSDPCHMSSPQPIEGIDRETLYILRKRSAPMRLEEDKWRDTYQVLFPDVADSDIPSPYYDGDSPTEESRRFRRELLQRVRSELFATAEQESGAVEQNLLRQVAAIIQRCETDLLNTFHAAPIVQRHANTNGLNGAHQFQNHRTLTPNQRRSSPQVEAMPISAPPTVDTFPPRQVERTAHAPTPQQQYPHETDVQLPNLPWEDLSTSTWIDWDAVFPPGPEVQNAERGGALPNFTAPVWT